MERAQLLKEARLKKRLPRERVAERLGVDPTTVTRWENGASTPQPINLFNLCELYGVTPRELGFDEHPLSEGLPIVTQNTMVFDEGDDDSPLLPFRKQDLTLCLMRVVWNWPYNHARYQELQTMITLELEDNSSIMNPDEQMNRRDALRRLALLPIEMCGLSALHAVLKRPNEEILAHCAAGITACWYLRKGKEPGFSSDAVSQYIPTLKAIVKTAPTAQRKSASELLVQCLLLKSTLARHVDGSNEAVMYARQAEKYSEIAENSLLQVLALRTQAAASYYGNQWEQALLAAEKARSLLPKKQEDTVPAVVQSYVYAGLATYQAYNGKKQDSLSSLGKAHTLFFAQSPDQSAPIWIDHNEANLILNDGMTHYHLGLHKQALDSFAQTRKIQQDSLARIEILIDEVLAELGRDDQPRDMERCIDLWIQGIEGAKLLQSSQRLNEAIQVYTAMRAAWPGEQRIKGLREYIVH